MCDSPLHQYLLSLPVYPSHVLKFWVSESRFGPRNLHFTRMSQVTCRAGEQVWELLSCRRHAVSWIYVVIIVLIL